MRTASRPPGGILKYTDSNIVSVITQKTTRAYTHKFLRCHSICQLFYSLGLVAGRNDMPGLALAAHINFTLRHWHDFHSLIHKIMSFILPRLLYCCLEHLSQEPVRTWKRVQFTGMRSHFWKACLTNSGIINRSENITIYKIYTRQIEIKFIAFFFFLDFNLVMDSNFHTSEQLYFLKKGLTSVLV